jgi:hypothetical protein
MHCKSTTLWRLWTFQAAKRFSVGSPTTSQGWKDFAASLLYFENLKHFIAKHRGNYHRHAQRVLFGSLCYCFQKGGTIGNGFPVKSYRMEGSTLQSLLMRQGLAKNTSLVRFEVFERSIWEEYGPELAEGRPYESRAQQLIRRNQAMSQLLDAADGLPLGLWPKILQTLQRRERAVAADDNSHPPCSWMFKCLRSRPDLLVCLR